MKRVLLILLTACGADPFTSSEGGLPGDAYVGESSTDVDSDSDPVDSSGLDARADSPDSSTALDAPCEHGAPACLAVWAAYCSKLKTCCANACPYTWANNGGSECTDHYLNNTSGYCSGNFIADQNRAARCDETCVGDIQAVSCTLIKQNQNGPGVSQISSACAAFWQ